GSITNNPSIDDGSNTCALRAPLGVANHVFWYFGPQNPHGFVTTRTATRLRFSSDGGATWASVPGICAPVCFATGAPGPGGTSSYTLGSVCCDPTGRNIGLRRCKTFDPAHPKLASWELMGGSGLAWNPTGDPGEIGLMDADPTNYGRVVIALQSRG